MTYGTAQPCFCGGWNSNSKEGEQKVSSDIGQQHEQGFTLFSSANDCNILLKDTARYFIMTRILK